MPTVGSMQPSVTLVLPSKSEPMPVALTLVSAFPSISRVRQMSWLQAGVRIHCVFMASQWSRPDGLWCRLRRCHYLPQVQFPQHRVLQWLLPSNWIGSANKHEQLLPVASCSTIAAGPLFLLAEQLIWQRQTPKILWHKKCQNLWIPTNATRKRIGFFHPTRWTSCTFHKMVNKGVWICGANFAIKTQWEKWLVFLYYFCSWDIMVFLRVISHCLISWIEMLNRLWTLVIKRLFAPFKNVVVVTTNKPLPAALQPAALIAVLQKPVSTWCLNLVSRFLPLRFKT